MKLKRLSIILIVGILILGMPAGVVTAGNTPQTENPPQTDNADRWSPTDESVNIPAPSEAPISPRTITATLYDNGPLVTHPGGGFDGADASALQTALGLTIYGFGDQFTAGNRMADDFVISDPGGWDIDQINFFSYQTNSPTTPSPITAVYYQIWNGPPNDPGSSVVFGDLVTNRLVSSTFSNIYRVQDIAMLNNARAIFIDTASAGVTLPSGTYWIDWTTDGSIAYSGPWAPPISILGQVVTGNALQYTTAGGAWAQALDGVSQQGMPFIIEGELAQPPSISLSKTVGTEAGICATTDAITVTVGTEVYYCYQITNTGEITLTMHDLYDTQLGEILDDYAFTLPPGESSPEVIVPETIHATTVNTATWTAFTGYDDTIAYNFEDISGTGTPFALTDDQVSGALPLGFSFNYFGTGYTAVYASSNGFLTVLPGQYSGCCSGDPIPDPADPNGVIVGWWDDLNPSLGGSLHYQILGSAPERRFIVQYTNIQHYGGGNAITLQYKLFEGSNLIEIHYAAAPSDGFSTHSAGIENQDGTKGVQYYYGLDPLTTPLAVRYPPYVEATATDAAVVNVLYPEIDVSPTSLDSRQVPDSVAIKTLTISNLGDPMTLLDWEIIESQPTANLPVSPAAAPQGSSPQKSSPAPELAGVAPSYGPAPIVGNGAPALSSRILLPNGTLAYSVEASNGYFTGFDLDVPEVLPNLAAFSSPGFPGAGEYVDGFIYITDSASLYKLDTAGTIVDTMGITLPPGEQTYTGMALDPTDGTVYLSSCDILTSILYTLDVETGTVTQIGEITNSPCTIAIAVDGNGDLYSYDITNDSMLLIDKTTGAGTVLGPLGFDANFGEGMGWDQATDTLYLAAFNNSTYQPELRIGDRTTGNTTLVGVLGQTIPGELVQLPFLAVPISTGCQGDIPWASVSPITGTLPGGESSPVEVTFDSTGLGMGVYTGTLCVMSNDPDEGLTTVPITMTLVPGADLSVSKSDSPDPVLVGDMITYTLVITNSGPTATTGVMLEDILPSSVTFVSASDGCTNVAGVVTCDVGDLAVDEIVTLYISVHTDATGIVTNTAEVWAYEPDPDPSNNIASAETLIKSAIFLPIMHK